MKGDLTKTCNGANATKTCNGANATKSSVGADSSKVCLEDDSTESFRGESTNHLDQVIFSFFYSDIQCKFTSRDPTIVGI